MADDSLPEAVEHAFKDCVQDPDGPVAHMMAQAAEDSADAARFLVASHKHVRTGRMFDSIRGKQDFDSLGFPRATVRAGGAANAFFAHVGTRAVANQYGMTFHRAAADFPFVVEGIWESTPLWMEG